MGNASLYLSGSGKAEAKSRASALVAVGKSGPPTNSVGSFDVTMRRQLTSEISMEIGFQSLDPQ